MKSKRISRAHWSGDFLGVKYVGAMMEFPNVLVLREKKSTIYTKRFNAKEIAENSKVFERESLGQCGSKLLKESFTIPCDKRIIDIHKQINGEGAMTINK